MPLVNCPGCGKEKISDKLLTCPDCGYQVKDYYDKHPTSKSNLVKQQAINKNQSTVSSLEYQEDIHMIAQDIHFIKNCFVASIFIIVIGFIFIILGSL